ncbi:aldo/keto reductase [Galbitalea sp. SE-J8]|uniref:aldo/keto reductase n=1 Tax=Galbitalea sp. SE-J8 TaxID=3054952 RepID=UPI00259CB4A7|nr:aldo/keto reductase [Galbitalea sp. SE-J8]MDM4763341.1 aldo/keto reductase [Galbitalea sp. SE-J8]
MASAPLAPLIPLDDGRSIPQLGLGTWPLKDREAEEAVATAIGLGYRHIDTAAKYGNERGVGRGVRGAGVPREELFVTTKLDGGYQGDDRAIAGLEDSLERLGLDYVDLLLIHWPLPKRGKFASTFRTFKKLQDAGLTRSIGVSNFKPAHLRTLIDGTGLTPAVNQIQLDPTITREDHRAFDAEHGIVTSSWSPLGGGAGATDLLAHPLITGIASRLDVTPGQVVLRWHVQAGLVPIPKSKNPERMRQNLDVFSFDLSAADLEQLATLALGPGAGVDSDRTGH